MAEVEDAALPPGWAWARLDEVCDIIGGITVDAKRRGADLIEVPYLRVANVQRGRLDLTIVKQIAVPVAQAERLRLRYGDVLLNEGGDRDKVGRGWVWEGQIDTCVFQNHVFRARPRHADVQPRWVSHYLNEAARGYFLAGSKQTTNLASLSLSKVAATPVAVPPADEQRRIVESVDALFAELHDVEAAMNRARERMTDYRASLLHAACTGALTAGWREANSHPEEDGAALLCRILAERRAAWEREELARLTAARKFPRGDGWKSKYSEPPGPTVPGVIELPNGWAWATLAQLGEFGRGKSRHRPRDDARLYGGDVPFIQTGDVSRSAGLIKTYTQTYSPLGLKQSKLWPAGTLCITIAANIAASGILGFSSCFPDSVVGLTPHYEKLGKFAHYFIQAERERLDAFAPATAQKNINMEVLNNLIIPIPPQSEMQEIIARVEAAQEAVADGITAANLGEMRQSILHAAFSGRLVPQDPADEPASTLLARLHADAAPSTPRRRTTRPGARP